MSKILLVSPDGATLRLLTQHLKNIGHDCASAHDSASIIPAAAAESPDLIVLDLGSELAGGAGVLAKVRSDQETCGIPVIALVEKKRVLDMVAWLEATPDDYLTKPFNADELALRIMALMRRRLPTKRIGSFVIDRRRSEVRLRERCFRLSPTEFRLFEALVERCGSVRPRQELLWDVWGYTHESRTLDTHIKRLRQKLGSTGDCIVNVRGAGYQLLWDTCEKAQLAVS